MTSTYTTNKGLELPGYNDYVDTWNVPVNADFTLIDTALGGSTLLNVTGVAGDVTLTTTQYRPPQLIISGTLTANVRFLIPSTVGGQWTVTNGATGAFAITLASAAGGSNVTIPSGTTIVSCDGSVSGMRLSITSTAAAKVDSFSTGSTGLTVNQSTGAVQLAGTLNIANGGTGTTTAPTSGQLLIGKSDGTYTVANITAASGSGLSVYNDPAGGIQLNAASSTGGTVTSVNLLAGTTGLTVTSSTGGAIINSGTFTLGGVVNVASGGTNLSSTPLAGQLLIGNAVSGYSLGFITGTPPISVTSAAGSISIAFSGTLPVANGGTGTTTSTGSGSVVLSSGPTLSSPTFTSPILGTPTSGNLSNCTGYAAGSLSGSVSLTSQVSGTLPISNGGTGTGTAFTSGSVVFAGASGVYSQSNSQLYWDNSNSRLGIGTSSPGYALTVSKSLSSNYVANFTNSSATAGSGAVSVSSQTGFALDANTNSTSSAVYSLVGTNLATSGGSGAVGVSSGSGGYAFRALVGGYSPFTGCHDGFILKTASPSPGDLLVDGVVVGKKLSDVITEVSVSTTANEPVIGIFVQTYPTDIGNVPPALKLPDGSPDPAWYVYAPTHNLAVINGVGEGCMNVVGEGGDIQKGDLLVTSSTPGKGMKQADHVIRSYTVARAREAATFAPGEEKQIACIYLCG